MFVRFATALSEIIGMEVDFETSGLYRDEISYWYNKKADIITISSNSTSICVTVQRVSQNTPSSFETTCKSILKLFRSKLRICVLGEQTEPALLSVCSHDSKPHYAKIKGSVLVCNRGQHEPDQHHSMWLNPPGELCDAFRRNYSSLCDAIKADDISKIAAELY